MAENTRPLRDVLAKLADGESPRVVGTNMRGVLLGSAAFASASSFLDFTPAGDGAAVRTVASRLRDTASLLDFVPVSRHEGIKAGTDTDDVAEFLGNALAAASAERGALHVPGGHYYLRSAINVENAVSIRGDGWSESPLPGAGTWFIHADPAIIPFNFAGFDARGTRFADIAFHQAHPLPEPGWEPTEYDWVVDCDSTYGSVEFDNIYLCPIRKFVRSEMSGRLYMNRVRGHVFEHLTWINNALDDPNIQNIKVWDFWINSPHIQAWQFANADMHRWGRVDTPFVGGEQTYLGCRSAIRISDFGDGTTTRASIDALHAESAKHLIWVDDTGAGAHVAMSRGDHWGMDGWGNAVPGSASIRLDAPATVEIGVLRAENVDTSYIMFPPHSGLVQIGIFRGANHDMGETGEPAFLLPTASEGVVNRLQLSTAPFIQASGAWALVNAGTNGVIGRPAEPTQFGEGIAYSYDAGRIFQTLTGADAAISHQIGTKGAGSDFRRVINGHLREYLHDEVDANTYLEWRAGLNFLQLLAQGAGANVDIFLTAKGVGSVHLGSAWNGPHLVMGSYHIWIDGSGKLRYKAGSPGGDTDGTEIATV